MIVYAIQQIHYEYDDEYHSESGLNKCLEVYKNKTKAEKRCEELNKEYNSKYELYNYDNEIITKHYIVVETELIGR